MKINGSPAYTKMGKGLINQGKLKPEKKLLEEPSSELQHMPESLKNKKKAVEKLVADQTAKKIARGGVITEEEREKLKVTDPEKLRTAEDANEKRISVSRKLANARTKAEAKAIISLEKSATFMIYDKNNPKHDELYVEAVSKAEVDYYQGKKAKPTTLRDMNDAKRQRLFDLRL